VRSVAMGFALFLRTCSRSRGRIAPLAEGGSEGVGTRGVVVVMGRGRGRCATLRVKRRTTRAPPLSPAVRPVLPGREPHRGWCGDSGGADACARSAHPCSPRHSPLPLAPCRDSRTVTQRGQTLNQNPYSNMYTRSQILYLGHTNYNGTDVAQYTRTRRHGE
jgi:hypothetical protein